MSKIRYTIRLYKAHDLDLITFAETHEFNIVKAIYSALVSFSKKEAFVIDIPPRKHKNFLNDKRVYVKTLTLDDKDDTKAIEILDKIKTHGNKCGIRQNIEVKSSYLTCTFS